MDVENVIREEVLHSKEEKSPFLFKYEEFFEDWENGRLPPVLEEKVRKSVMENLNGKPLNVIYIGKEEDKNKGVLFSFSPEYSRSSLDPVFSPVPPDELFQYIEGDSEEKKEFLLDFLRN